MWLNGPVQSITPRRLTDALVAFGALATLTTMAAMAGGVDFDLFLGAFALWALLPYAVLAAAAHRSSTPLFGRAFAAVAVPVVAFAVAVYGYAYLEPDAQGGLVFIFVPMLQLAATALVAALAGSVRLLRRA